MVDRSRADSLALSSIDPRLQHSDMDPIEWMRPENGHQRFQATDIAVDASFVLVLPHELGCRLLERRTGLTP